VGWNLKPGGTRRRPIELCLCTPSPQQQPKNKKTQQNYQQNRLVPATPCPLDQSLQRKNQKPSLRKTLFANHSNQFTTSFFNAPTPSASSSSSSSSSNLSQGTTARIGDASKQTLKNWKFDHLSPLETTNPQQKKFLGNSFFRRFKDAPTDAKQKQEREREREREGESSRRSRRSHGASQRREKRKETL
jgi:hypothetical protein